MERGGEPERVERDREEDSQRSGKTERGAKRGRETERQREGVV